MDKCQYIIEQISSATSELREDNDRAEFLERQREMLRRNMAVNESTFRNAPRSVLDYAGDSKSVYCGDKRTV